jgi:hypothetical protein
MKKSASVLVLAFLVVLVAGGAHAQDGLQGPIIGVSISSYDFGSVPTTAIAWTFVTITNTGDADLHVASIKTRAPFGDNNTTGMTIPPDGQAKFLLFFMPTTPGNFSDFCTIQSDAWNQANVYIPLTGQAYEM